MLDLAITIVYIGFNFADLISPNILLAQIQRIRWNTLGILQPHKVFTLLSRRGATEHSSTRPRFSTHHLLIVINVCIQIANKVKNLKKKNLEFFVW
jgi:hypothetical protein